VANNFLTKLFAPATLDANTSDAAFVARLNTILTQLAAHVNDRPFGLFSPQVLRDNLTVGAGFNWITTGTVTIPTGVTLRIESGAEWRAL
jgi:hypothetical protein